MNKGQLAYSIFSFIIGVLISYYCNVVTIIAFMGGLVLSLIGDFIINKKISSK